MDLQDLKYPIGTFEKPETITASQIEKWIHTIQDFPSSITQLIENLSEDSLAKTYRLDGWNIKQLVHHCSDSHMNAFIRFKLTLTENTPQIKPYFEHKWAELPDTVSTPIEASLKLIEGLHLRWAILLKALEPEDLERTYIHPEHGKQFTLAETIGMYDWHCRHHLAHIKSALNS
ncbi:YfiT family bacillithiol transferase [Leeuwenhoekiella aestuarii]|uniref:DinB family protein n=1 Tax=Leeuwenhoekiella aestuarii TaxID=2249426 RepID=A0A4Q0NT66_9FLAO|nr:putative metal-dependent hydrolase [Leeuwenhoekiella aestuarii]RXG14345.1 DinB family protein [Leeuwenhoekiella aestuarii]